MPKPQPSPNRHHFRVWVKWVIESGTLEKLPRTYDPDESQPPRMTEHYAQELLADLRDPDARKILATTRTGALLDLFDARGDRALLMLAGRPRIRAPCPR